MKKIFKVQWYNSDGYGIMDNTAVVVQAENSEEAAALAREHLTQLINDIDTFLEKYEHVDVEDITYQPVLSTNISTI